jgi:protein transport protein SEC24
LPETGSACYFQAALLFTSSTGERRIRVHTLALPTTNKLANVFAGADSQALVCMLAKMGA